MQCPVYSVRCPAQSSLSRLPTHALQLTSELLRIPLQAAGGAAKTGLDYVGIGLGYAKQVRSWRTTGDGITAPDCFTHNARHLRCVDCHPCSSRLRKKDELRLACRRMTRRLQL